MKYANRNKTHGYGPQMTSGKKPVILLLLMLCMSPLLSAQTLSFDEFTEMGKKYLKADQLENIKTYLPGNFSVTALDFGDYTGDNVNDFAIAVKPKGRRDKTIFTYLFADSLGQYVPVLRDTMEYFELPIEIGFSINKGTCYTTHKINDRSWTIVGVSFMRNEYSLVDLYKTDVFPLTKRNSIGKEDYHNYNDLSASAGYFDLNTLRDFKKNKFFSFPVYDLKRNVYTSYHSAVRVDNSWFWEDSLNERIDIGEIEFRRDSGYIMFDMHLNKSALSLMAKNGTGKISIYFDRNTDRLSKGSVRKPVFRTSLNDDTGFIEAVFLPGTSALNITDVSFAGNFDKGKLAFIQPVASESEHYRLRIPVELLNLPEGQNEAGIFIKLQIRTADGRTLELKSSNGYDYDPSSYGRLIMIDKGKYYGRVVNDKFRNLLEKTARNGIIPAGSELTGNR